MAIVNNKFPIKFIGKVGSVVGTTYRGKHTVRSLSLKKRTNNSPKQQIQKAKFSMAVEFVHRLAALYDITYKQRAGTATPRNIAVSDFVSNAITGVYPEFRIDYSKVMISSGNLAPASASVEIKGGKIIWSWEPNIGINGAEANDQSVIVAYCPESQQAIYKVNASSRWDGKAMLDAHPFVGYKVVTYLGFTSLNQRRISNSEFTGEYKVN